MLFGLTNVPASFQGLINDTLREGLDKFILVYLDNIIIFSETEKEYIGYIRWVLE